MKLKLKHNPNTVQVQTFLTIMTKTQAYRHSLIYFMYAYMYLSDNFLSLETFSQLKHCLKCSVLEYNTPSSNSCSRNTWNCFCAAELIRNQFNVTGAELITGFVAPVQWLNMTTLILFFFLGGGCNSYSNQHNVIVAAQKSFSALLIWITWKLSQLLWIIPCKQSGNVSAHLKMHTKNRTYIY